MSPRCVSNSKSQCDLISRTRNDPSLGAMTFVKQHARSIRTQHRINMAPTPHYTLLQGELSLLITFPKYDEIFSKFPVSGRIGGIGMLHCMNVSQIVADSYQIDKL